MWGCLRFLIRRTLAWLLAGCRADRLLSPRRQDMSGLLFSSSFVLFCRFYFSPDFFEDSHPFRGQKASFGSITNFCLFLEKIQDKLVFLVCLNRHQFT